MSGLLPVLLPRASDTRVLTAGSDVSRIIGYRTKKTVIHCWKEIIRQVLILRTESVLLENRNVTNLVTNPFNGSSAVNSLVYHDPEGDFDVKFTHLSASGSIANSLHVLSVALGAVFHLAFAHGAEYNFQERTVDWIDGGVRLRVTIDGADEQPLTINDVNGLFRGIIWMIRTTGLTVSTATFKMMRDGLDMICLGDWGFTQTDVPSD